MKSIGCVMCVWDEERMIPLALESSKDFVDRYVIVDKGSKDNTLKNIKQCADQWNLETEVLVKPDLSLKESLLFGVKKIDSDWVLLQDGDEVCHTDGLNSIHNLKKFLKFQNIALWTRLTIISNDLLHTHKPYHQPPHPFLYHNNHSFQPQRNHRAIPVYVGARIFLNRIYKFNCRIKTRKRDNLGILEPYVEKEHGYYPEVIRKYIEQGLIRGFENT